MLLKVSDTLIARIKLNPVPAYKLAQRAGINPVTLSKLMNGIDPVKGEQDPRILAIAKLVGVPESECFEPAEEIDGSYS